MKRMTEAEKAYLNKQQFTKGQRLVVTYDLDAYDDLRLGDIVIVTDSLQYHDGGVRIVNTRNHNRNGYFRFRFIPEKLEVGQIDKLTGNRGVKPYA